MSEDKQRNVEEETPTMRKLRVLVHQVGTGAIAFETVIPQAILTLLLVGSSMWLVVNGQDIPDWLLIADGSIIGFYFGSDYEFRKMTGKATKNAQR